MGLSRLAEKCRICPNVDTCQNKRMEALGFLDGPCERELAAGTATAGPVNIGLVNIGPADAVTAFHDAVEKAVAIAAQIPQHIICKHYLP